MSFYVDLKVTDLAPLINVHMTPSTYLIYSLLLGKYYWFLKLSAMIKVTTFRFHRLGFKIQMLDILTQDNFFRLELCLYAGNWSHEWLFQRLSYRLKEWYMKVLSILFDIIMGLCFISLYSMVNIFTWMGFWFDYLLVFFLISY